MNRQRKILITVIYNDLGIIVDTKAEELDLSSNLQQTCNQLATDCISRQQAIEGLYDVFFDDELNAAYPDKADVVLDVIRKLPTVQPEVLDCGSGDLVKDSQRLVEASSNDMISRQQAIEAFEPEHHTDWYTPTIIKTLEELPHAQPPASECWRCNCKKMNTVHGLDGTVYTQDKDRQGWTGQITSAQPEKTCRGYNVTELIGFATACRRAGVDEKDLKNFAQNCEFAWKVMQKETYSAIEEAFEKYSDVSMCKDAEDTEEVIETQVGSLIFRDKVQYGIQEKLKAAYRDGYTAAYEMHCCGGSGARMDGEEND